MEPQILETSITKVDHLIHVSDIHIRKRERHEEYRTVFARLCEEIRKYPHSVIVITGDTVHDKTELVPESIDTLRRMLIDMTNITDVVIIIGNHDVNIFNVGSLDSLTPIITDLRTEHRIHLLAEGGAYRFGRTNLVFGVTTVWQNRVTDIDEYTLKDTDTKIALYHGMIHGCTLDNGIKALNNSRCTNSSYFNVSDFDAYDMTLLGDVHKHQFLKADRSMAYAGSLIQQKRDEDLIEHGFILWDTRKLTGEFYRIPSDYGMIELNISDGIEEYVKKIESGNTGRPKKSGRLIPEYSNSMIPLNLDVKLRYSSIESRDNFKDIYSVITNVLGKNIIRTSELIFSPNNHDLGINILKDVIQFGKTKSTKVIKTKTSQDVENKNNKTEDRTQLIKIKNDETVVQAVMRYYDRKFSLESEGVLGSTRELVRTEVSTILKDIKYNYDSDIKNIKLKTIEFGNMFIYLDKNKIDFDKFDKIVGLNAGNYQGKSSFIDIILYSIYGKCSRGKRFDILNIEKNGMSSRITLDVNGVEYVISRDSYINSRKNRDLKESVIFCEGGVDITADDRIKTHKLIESKICSYSDMVNNSFVLQKNGSSFTDLTDREKKDILCKMARLDVFDRVFHEAKSRHFSHSQNFGKTVRKLDPLMNKYLTVAEIASVLPKSNTKKSSQESNQRKIELIKETIRNRTSELEGKIKHCRKQIDISNRKLRELEKEESILSTDLNYGIQLDHTVETYQRLIHERDTLQISIIDIVSDIIRLENEMNEVESYSEMKQDLIIKEKANRYNLAVLNQDLLELHTYLNSTDRDEDQIQQSLDSNRDKLIQLQDELIKINRKRDELRDRIEYLRGLAEIDKIVIQNVTRIKEIEKEKKANEDAIRTNSDEITRSEQDLESLSKHEYNPDCEQCMSNPITKNVLHYRSRISELNKDNRLLKKRNKTHDHDISKLRYVILNGVKLDCISMYNESSCRDDQINRIEQEDVALRNRSILLTSQIDIMKVNIKTDENDLSKIRSDIGIRESISNVKEQIKTLENDPDIIELRSRIDSISATMRKLDELHSRKQSIKSKLDECNREIQRIETLDIIELRIKMVTRSNLTQRIERIRGRIQRRATHLQKLQQNLNKYRDQLNELTLDSERFEEIEQSIREESNSKLVLEQIKKLLDRSGLVDEMLSKDIIPFLQRNINNILSDVGHYRIDITYKNQNVNIYKDSGLNVAMSSGYESYLLDLVFRISLSQINNHIRTNFLVIDEGFNACDAEHKNNIRDLLEYMRTYFSWILVISHDDYIKSFYDHSIQIQSIRGLSDESGLWIDGSRINNIDSVQAISDAISDADLETAMLRIHNVNRKPNKSKTSKKRAKVTRAKVIRRIKQN